MADTAYTPAHALAFVGTGTVLGAAPVPLAITPAGPGSGAVPAPASAFRGDQAAGLSASAGVAQSRSRPAALAECQDDGVASREAGAGWASSGRAPFMNAPGRPRRRIHRHPAFHLTPASAAARLTPSLGSGSNGNREKGDSCSRRVMMRR